MTDSSNILSSIPPINMGDDLLSKPMDIFILDDSSTPARSSKYQLALERLQSIKGVPSIPSIRKDQCIIRKDQLKHYFSTNVNALDSYALASNNLQSINPNEYLSNLLLTNSISTGKQGTTFIDFANHGLVGQFNLTPLDIPPITLPVCSSSFLESLEDEVADRFPLADTVEASLHNSLEEYEWGILIHNLTSIVENDEELKEWIEKKVRKRLSTFKRIIAKAFHGCGFQYTFKPSFHIKHMYLDLKTSIKDAVKLSESYFQTSFMLINSKYFIYEKTNF